MFSPIADYKRAAKTLEADGIPLAKVDGTKEPELAKEYMIQVTKRLTLENCLKGN